jgi:hypothetical protein
MGKRNPANKGKGKVIGAVFAPVQHGGQALNAVLMASSKKGAGAIATQLWAVLPGQGSKAPAFVLVTSIVGAGTTSTGMALAAAQALVGLTALLAYLALCLHPLRRPKLRPQVRPLAPSRYLAVT